MFSPQQLLFLPIIAALFSLFIAATPGAKVLPKDEVEALRDIANTLGKKDWDFSENPCTNTSSWFEPPNPAGFPDNQVTCDCSFSVDTFCHVVNISLKGQDLQGRLPPEIVRLPYLQQIDLYGNYLNGSIPEEWGSTNLVMIGLGVNRLSGEIPISLGNISSLRNLTVDYNQLSGVLPLELGNLPKIEKFVISSNNFTGELPQTFAKLTTLKEFRINDNQFTGQIPKFIQNWKNIERLVIQASGLVGPIPSEISTLTKLKDLIISDLNGAEIEFPPLSNMKNMHNLILRSCNIKGPLPKYFAELMTKLKVIDLSFNKLSGEVPSNFTELTNPIDEQYMYLTGNMLTGPAPQRKPGKYHIDMSYNNFTKNSTIKCQDQDQIVNLFASSSTLNDSTGSDSCIPNSSKCPYFNNFLHINCGGEKAIRINKDTEYEPDSYPSGPSTLFFNRQNTWACSNTGHFLDGESKPEDYIAKTSSTLLMRNSELYTQARLSPISLTYYAYCMKNGKYNVKLHFAEIMFTNNRSYTSLGRRIFDIYIQGNPVWKDFNIAKEAGGIGKEIIKRYTALVTNNTLQIRLYWAGRGTDAIPRKGVYGPLISAISVERYKHSITAMVVGIVAGATFVAVILIGALWWKGYLRFGKKMDTELRSLGNFSLGQLKSATNNFNLSNKIGEGGFGSVYKGRLSNGTAIAVKMLSAKSSQGNREFVNEIGIISAQQHPNLVKLYGCCTEGDQLLLVYEYLENNNLARALFGLEEHQLKLDWPTRWRICVGIARGIAYLHEESSVKVVHRDIKATNVLLDKDLNPKISDFGLARLNEDENTHISTRVAGTYGYMAPEYAIRGYCTDKVDVYSFGIVALEILSGRRNAITRKNDEPLLLLDWAHILKKEGKLKELVDPRLGSDYNEEEAMLMIKVIFLCTDTSPASRPSMSSTVRMLEGQVPVAESILETSASFETDKAKLEELKNYYQFSSKQHSKNYNSTQSQSTSTDHPWTASSTSAADLYPVNLDSEYLKARDN